MSVLLVTRSTLVSRKLWTPAVESTSSTSVSAAESEAKLFGGSCRFIEKERLSLFFRLQLLNRVANNSF